MAKKSSVNKNERRRKLVKQYDERRDTLQKAANDQSISEQARFRARLKRAALPRNSAAVRIRNRCEVTGRPRGTYRKFKMSRIARRELGSPGMIPGLVKSSW